MNYNFLSKFQTYNYHYNFINYKVIFMKQNTIKERNDLNGNYKYSKRFL